MIAFCAAVVSVRSENHSGRIECVCLIIQYSNGHYNIQYNILYINNIKLLSLKEKKIAVNMFLCLSVLSTLISNCRQGNYLTSLFISRYRNIQLYTCKIYLYTYKIQLYTYKIQLYTYKILALTRKICGIISKKLQKFSIIQILMSNLSVKTTVFCYFLQLFRYPTNFARLRLQQIRY